MKKFAILVICLLTTPALAQQQPQQKFTFAFTAQELDMIGKALGRLPYEEVAAVVSTIQGQYFQQVQAAAKAKADAEKAAAEEKSKSKSEEK